MEKQTLCPICEKVLTVDLFPEFLYCEECEVGVKRVECRYSLGQARAFFNTAWWVNKHHNDLSAKLAACSIIKCVKGLDGVRNILDIGCGSGLLVDMLVGEGYESTGLDFSAEAINFARTHKRGVYVCGAVNDIWAKYDLIIMSHLLEHIDNPVRYLRQVAQLLKPDGLLLVEVPNLDSYNTKSIWRRESHRQLFEHTHNVAFSKKGLSLLLGKAGYIVRETNTKTLGGSLLNRLVSGLYRRLRGNPTIYRKQEPTGRVTLDRRHRVYNTIAESVLVRYLCLIPNRLSERRGRGVGLSILATIPREGVDAD